MNTVCSSRRGKTAHPQEEEIPFTTVTRNAIPLDKRKSSLRSNGRTIYSVSTTADGKEERTPAAGRKSLRWSKSELPLEKASVETTNSKADENNSSATGKLPQASRVQTHGRQQPTDSLREKKVNPSMLRAGRFKKNTLTTDNTRQTCHVFSSRACEASQKKASLTFGKNSFLLRVVQTFFCKPRIRGRSIEVAILARTASTSA